MHGLPQPRTPAQHARHSRMLRVAASMVIKGGEEALVIRDLAAQAKVSTTALYRYFPSKRHLILAIAIDSYASGLMPRHLQELGDGTVGERVGEMLVRYFRRMQQQDKLTGAIMRALSDPDRSLEPLRAELGRLHRDLLTAAAGGPFTPEQRAVLFIVNAVWDDGLRSWLNGSRSADDVCEMLRLSCRVLDHPEVIGTTDHDPTAV